MERVLIKKYAVVLGISGFFLTGRAVFYAAFVHEQQLWGETGYCRFCVFCKGASTSGSGGSGQNRPPFVPSSSRCSHCRCCVQYMCSRSVTHTHGAPGRYRIGNLTVSFPPERKTGEIHSLIFVFKLFFQQLKKKKTKQNKPHCYHDPSSSEH